MKHTGKCCFSVLAIVLCLSLVTVAGQQQTNNVSPSDEASLRELVNGFIATYGSKDAQAQMRLWTEKSPQYATHKQTIEQLFKKPETIEAKDLAIRKIAVNGDNASVRFDVEMSPPGPQPGRPANGLVPRFSSLYCIRENGQWVILRLANAFTELADNIVTAKTPEERSNLMASEKMMPNSDLVSALNSRGLRQFSRGEYPEALRIFLFTAGIAEQTGEKLGLAFTLNNLGVIYHYQGNYGLAMETLEHSLALAKELKKDDGIAHLTNNMAMIYHAQGNIPLALQYYEESLKQCQVLNSDREVALRLSNIGSVYKSIGNYPVALDYLGRSLKLYENKKLDSGIASTHVSIGEVYIAQGDYTSALESISRAKSEFEQISDKAGMANALADIGQIYYFQGDQAKAFEFASKAADLAREIGSREILWNALSTMGNTYRAQGKQSEARQSFDESIKTIEDIRGQVAGDEQDVQRYFENKTSPYTEMVDLLVSMKDNASALSYAERAKGRVLLDILRSGRVNITRSMTAQEIEQEKQILGQLAALNTQFQREITRPQPDKKQIDDLNSQLTKVRLTHEQFQTSLYAAHQELKAQRGQSQPIKSEDISQLIPNPSTALMEYVVTDHKTLLFVATRDNAASVDKQTGSARADFPGLRVYSINIDQKSLTQMVSDFRDKVSKRDLLFRAPAGKLYDLLVKPAEAQLKGKTNIVIVPDGILWELPFQALTNSENHYMIETSAISYAPSITVLSEMEKVRAKRIGVRSSNVLAFGNPTLGDLTVARVKGINRDASLRDLPDAEAEVKGIGQIYGPNESRIYTGSEARKDLFKAEAGKYRILHLATHGLLNNASPMYSQIVLAQGTDGKQDGLLEAWEIMNMNLSADTVVLSACETARGRIGAGEGVTGLSWALFVAGSPTTVVSQWKVDSASTSQLMLEFHKKLKAGTLQAESQTKAESLREAALKLLSNRQYAHPFYWAGFVLVGDGY